MPTIATVRRRAVVALIERAMRDNRADLALAYFADLPPTEQEPVRALLRRRLLRAARRERPMS